jgi:hypothetical protein
MKRKKNRPLRKAEQSNREQRLVCLMNEDEMRVVKRYLERHKVTNKSRWMRETILKVIHQHNADDYPTLFCEHEMRR